MNIVLLRHPDYAGSYSISLYTKMIASGMRGRGHKVEIWTAGNFFYRLPFPQPLKKWMGYIDRFLVFPLQFKRRIKKLSPETLFVFADHALGPWISLAASRPHIIHCHDFMAQRSALGEISENKVGLSGKIYQELIRRGYRKGRNFISISKKTRKDLERFLGRIPEISEVIYNGLNQNYKPEDPTAARQKLRKELKLPLEEGYILHVGGSQFYKNRKGVIEIYDSFRKRCSYKVPLLFVGAPPEGDLKRVFENTIFKKDIYFISNISNKLLQLTYQGANVLLFPSLDEGFGWPIAEAMASGCPVVTTNLAPMNEVAGAEACYVLRRPAGEDADFWAAESADELIRLFNLPQEERYSLIESGLENAKRFNTEDALAKIENVYQEILKQEVASQPLKVSPEPI